VLIEVTLPFRLDKFRGSISVVTTAFFQTFPIRNSSVALPFDATESRLRMGHSTARRPDLARDNILYGPQNCCENWPIIYL
jgi:hypothetical protein